MFSTCLAEKKRSGGIKAHDATHVDGGVFGGGRKGLFQLTLRLRKMTDIERTANVYALSAFIKTDMQRRICHHVVIFFIIKPLVQKAA